MPRSLHGRVEVTEDTLGEACEAVAERVAEVGPGFAVVKRVEFERRFDFLFLELQDDPDNLLPVTQKTRDDLVKLGDAMADRGRDAAAGDSNFSSAFTYFGQFVDHDITLEKSGQPGMKPPVEEDLTPLPLEDIREQTRNVRTGVLELDSVYNFPARRDPEPNGLKMKIGKVALSGGRPIGDPRNDENTIIAQLHVAFLLAHNKLVDEAAPPNRFKKAKRRLRRHYQHIVLHDFLKQVAEPVIVDDIIENGNRVYDPDEDEFFMPLEYSVAAFRFGHSMVRAKYNFNVNFPEASLGELFTFTALSGELGEFETLPEIWIIQWERFFRGNESFNKARRIDTELVEPLEHLQTMQGTEEGEGDPRRLAAKLAVRNLLRGYQLRMPTGQAVARALRKKLQGVRDVPVLTPQQIRNAAASDKQREVLQEAGFDRRTPLWYYILAEAAFLRKGRRLGPVGSTIVAEVLVGLVRRSPDSILAPGSTWKPNLPSEEPGKFTLSDLLRYAEVLKDD
jgi:hypothetical protein